MKHILIFIMIMLCSCRTQQAVLASHTVERDSVVVTTTVMDTVIRIEPDSSLIRALLECDSLGQVHIRQIYDYQAGTRLKPPQVIVKDNILTASAYSQALEKRIELLSKQVEYYKDRTTIKMQEVNVLTAWQKIRLSIANIILILLGALVGLQIFRIFR